MPLQETSGNSTQDAYGGGAAVVPNYIEDVFSTWLYTVDGTTTQAIPNGIDLTTYGGIVWEKMRSNAAGNAVTYQSASKYLYTNTTAAAYNTGVTFTNNGYTMNSTYGPWSPTGATMASWTFRKQPKFFDIVTYTGTGSNATISHNLGSVPGCIIVKRTDGGGGNWAVYHRGTSAGNKYLFLNRTDAEDSGFFWNPTSTTFDISYVLGLTATGGTYVAYLFAHNAGGFGLTGTDNVISCGSFTTDASGNATVNLGYEPQFILFKRIDSTTGGDWYVYDTMRGMPNNAGTSITAAPSLSPNTSGTELNWQQYVNATGFVVGPGAYSFSYSTASYIYIAIRRGPMKVPTDATKVFSPNSTSGTTGTPITTGFPIDWQLLGINAGNVYNQRSSTRLTGVNTDGSSNSQYLVTGNTNAEAATSSVTKNWNNTGFQVPSLNSGSPIITWNFGRAPSFFDEVCYTNTGSSQQIAFTTLGTTPELVIYKARGTTSDWYVLAKAGSLYYGLKLNTTAASAFNDTAANLGITSTYFDPALGWGGPSSYTYVAYLFATCAGVSKVGSYTGNGTTQAIACGFTGGARFVLIRRTDSTGDWYVYDTARGMTTLTDPYLLLNSSAAEAATLGSVTTTTGGFTVNASILSAINTSSASYIFLAIA